jgi:hypothetical protein
MSIKHRNQILDTLGGLVTDIKQPIEKAFQNLTNIVFDFNHERLINAIEKRKGKEQETQKPSDIIIDIKEINK